MKTYCLSLNQNNCPVLPPEANGCFLFQSREKLEAFIIADWFFKDVKEDDIKEIDGSLFNFESEQ